MKRVRAATPGVGLGLVITRAIVLAHGGSLSFESETGVGTEFSVVVPGGDPSAVLSALPVP